MFQIRFRCSTALASLATTLLATLISSCATKIENLKTDEQAQSREDHGYLLLGVDTNWPLYKLEISGEKEIFLSHEDLKFGSNYILASVPAGEYRFRKLWRDRMWAYKLKREDWSFEIKPNTINYVGDITAQNSGIWKPRARLALMNKSSSALEFVEINLPKTLEEKAIEYQGPGEDKFLQITRKK